MKLLPHFMILSVVLLGSLYAQTSDSCFARFVPERDDDFAWENDKVAFRVYGPTLRNKGVNSGIDCWLKRVDYPIINKWYAGHLKGISYHQDHGEGYDPYHVGSSRGCGGLGLWIDGEIIHSETFSNWNILESSDSKVRFVLSYEWEYEGEHYREEKEISLKKGRQLYDAKSRFYKNGEIASNLSIAVGLTTHDGQAVPSVDVQSGWITCWEEIDGLGLGTAIVMNSNRINRSEIIESDQRGQSHVLFVTETDADGCVEYSAGYGWEKAEDINSAQEWIDYVSRK